MHSGPGIRQTGHGQLWAVDQMTNRGSTLDFHFHFSCFIFILAFFPLSLSCFPPLGFLFHHLPLPSITTMFSISRQTTLRRSLRQLCIHTRTISSARPPFHAGRITIVTPTSTTTTAIRHSHSHSSSQPTKQCPTCRAHLPLAVSPCPNCAALVPIPTDVSYYSLFDLTPRSPAADSAGGQSNQERIRKELSALEGGGYVLDTRDLRSRFFKRQQGCHPDSYTGQGKVGPLLPSSSGFHGSCTD